MKGITLAFFLGAVYLASAVPVESPVEVESEGEFQYPRFIKFPDAEGVLHDVDLEEEPDWKLLEDITRNSNNGYFLYTRRNQNIAQTLTMNNANSVYNSNFNPGLPTVVIVHGWLGTRLADPNPTVRKALLDKMDCNVISLDWSRYSLATYTTAMYAVPGVGQGLGNFLLFLNSVTGAPFNTMHLVGFSLGAHIVGNAGRTMGGRAARVTGLDPAGPGWSYNRNRLGPSDGVYVEAIHTDGGYLVGGYGIGSAIADVDFFPNGGVSQPGCLTNLCQHNRAWEFFAATVTYNHLSGRRCTTSTQVSLNTCFGVSLNMGNADVTKSGTSGMYRVNTGRRYPY